MGGTSFPPKNPTDGNIAAFGFLGATARVAADFDFFGKTDCVAVVVCFFGTAVRVEVAFYFWGTPAHMEPPLGTAWVTVGSGNVTAWPLVEWASSRRTPKIGTPVVLPASKTEQHFIILSRTPCGDFVNE